jgi:hypothetical protein
METPIPVKNTSAGDGGQKEAIIESAAHGLARRAEGA